MQSIGSLIKYTHPPAPKDESLYNQKAPTPTTVEELKELRKLPKYSVLQKLVAAVYFTIFGIPRSILAIVFILTGYASFVLLCAIWRAFGRGEGFRGFLKRYYAILGRIFLFILGFVHVNYHGSFNPEARFIVCNHICFFDGWFFLPLSPRPLAKKELFHFPVMKDMLEVLDGIPVDRSQHSGVAQKMIESANNTSNPPIFIAPEGATTSGEYMFRFHMGAFLSDLPVQPVAIKYTIWGGSRKIHHMSYFHNYPIQFIHFLGIPAITVDVNFMDPMTLKTEGKNDPRQFADEVELKIANALGVRLISLSNGAIFQKNEAKEQ